MKRIDNQHDKDRFEHVATLLAHELTKSGLNANKSETKLADGDEENGWYATMGSWSVGRPKIEVWFDHWLDESKRSFWFGFAGERRQVTKFLDDLAFAKAPAVWNHQHFKGETGSRSTVVKKHDGLVYERYRGDSSYLGKYDVGFKQDRTPETLVDDATTFLLESIDKADRAEAKRNSGETEYEANVLGRIGQRKFRQKLEMRWDHKCAITKCGIPEALRASHIIPWHSDKRLRLDQSNGLLLVATIDALFDQHLISFDDDGRIMFAKINPEERKVLALDGTKLQKPLSPEEKANLRQHRAEAERRWNCKLAVA